LLLFFKLILAIKLDMSQFFVNIPKQKSYNLFFVIELYTDNYTENKIDIFEV